MKITIEIEIDATELMDSVFNNLWVSSSPWCLSYHYDWEDANRGDTPVTVECWGETWGAEPVKKVVTALDLVKGLEKAINGHNYHCGSPITADLEEWDTCCADTVLQYAIYGEVVFG